ncbi:hypothetical protein DRN73_00385 [Candidatus Pacearchaeota archaeon]|nr:MAG: hypothetical protein DRN73_00385 [Candidatus Pacearchaeota archaeon]
MEIAKKTNKCDPEVYNLLALVYMAKHDFAKAEECLNKALELNPYFSQAYNNFGALRMLQKRYDEAVYFFKKALENPLYVESFIARTNLGWAYYKLGDKKKAISTLLKSLEENALYSKTLVYLGRIYMDEGNLEIAKFYLKRAVKIDRNSQEVRYYLAEVFFRLGDFKIAKELWDSIIQLNPASEWATLAAQRLYFLEKLKTHVNSSK